jgi:hypothetical protein
MPVPIKTTLVVDNQEDEYDKMRKTHARGDEMVVQAWVVRGIWLMSNLSFRFGVGEE